MADAQNRILALTFNQDCTSLAVSTSKNYTIYLIEPDNKINAIHDCAYDSAHIIERLFSSSLIAIVSTQAPRNLKIYHFTKGAEIVSYTYVNTIHAVKLNRLRLVVLLEDSIFIHDMRDMKLLHRILSVPLHPVGLCALSSSDVKPYFAYPGSTQTGDVHIFDTVALRSVSTINAHESVLAAISFDSTGTKIATASNKGTVIRVHNTIDGSCLFEFRRGIRRVANIYSLAFSPDGIFLAASSNTETIHIFRLIQQTEAPPEQINSWSRMFNYVLGGITYYLPRSPADVLNQDRAFATIHLQEPGMKTVLAMNVFDKTLKLFVAGYDSVLCIYEVDTNEGGECKKINQCLLLNAAEYVHYQQPTGNSNQRSATSDESNQIHLQNSTPPHEASNKSIVRSFTQDSRKDHQEYGTATEDEGSLPKLPYPPSNDEQ